MGLLGGCSASSSRGGWPMPRGSTWPRRLRPQTHALLAPEAARMVSPPGKLAPRRLFLGAAVMAGLTVVSVLGLRDGRASSHPDGPDPRSCRQPSSEDVDLAVALEH
ncbi:MAG: hypothetical protein U0835_12185 [Isosphaeraceae bacterium]